MTTGRISTKPIFTMELNWLAGDSRDLDGPFGRRHFQRGGHGRVTGKDFNGAVQEHLTTNYGRLSADGRIEHIDAWVTIQLDGGEAILLQVRGRKSPRYGAGNSRLQIMFHAGTGPHDWLNAVQAIGVGRTENGVEIVDVHVIKTVEEGADSDPSAPGFDGELILIRKSDHDTGSKRHVIVNPLGGRYLSVAEGGGGFHGPRLSGKYLTGYSWSPHRCNFSDNKHLLQYDVHTLLEAEDSTPILMSYTGASSSENAIPDWYTAVLFEVPAGPHEWLNEVLAVGVGRWTGDGAQYHVYAID